MYFADIFQATSKKYQILNLLQTDFRIFDTIVPQNTNAKYGYSVLVEIPRQTTIEECIKYAFREYDSNKSE